MPEFSLTRRRENAGDGTSTKRIFGAPIKPRPTLTTAYSPLPGQGPGPLVSWLPQEKGCNLHYFKTIGKDIFWSIPAKRQAHDPSHSRMLKNSFSARLLKKVQMQGGAPIFRWVPGEVRGVLSPYVAVPRERAGYPSGGWVPQMGLFQQPDRAGPPIRPHPVAGPERWRAPSPAAGPWPASRPPGPAPRSPANAASRRAGASR